MTLAYATTINGIDCYGSIAGLSCDIAVVHENELDDIIFAIEPDEYRDFAELVDDLQKTQAPYESRIVEIQAH